VAITLSEPREQRMLANIERLTRRPITVASIPTVADLRKSRLQRLTDTLRTALLSGDRGGFSEVVDELSSEFNLRDIAIAAVQFASAASGNVVDDKEIPDASQPKVRHERPTSGDRPDRGARPDRGNDARPDRSKDRGNDRTSTGPGGDKRRSSGTTTKLYIGLGKTARITPGDLVGAIANETDLVGREIGPITVGKSFSTVGVPENSVEKVITALRRTTIKGQKVTIRRYVDEDR
jgi:ATP-dependent RNA helicase DeaD